MPVDDPKNSAAHVTIKGGGITLTVLLGDGSPVLTGGVTTWDTVTRPKRTSMTRFSGRAPFGQDIPVMFDGLTNDPPNDNQEDRISKLETLARGPHVVSLGGVALHQELDWVFSGIDWDNQHTIWRRGKNGAFRIRQAATVHLLQYIKDVVRKTPAEPKVGKDPSTKTTVPKGMTLKQIANIEFGDPDKWHRLVIDNPILTILGLDNPRSFLPAGFALTVYDGAIPFFTVP